MTLEYQDSPSRRRSGSGSSASRSPRKKVSRSRSKSKALLDRAVQHGWVEHVCDYKRCGFPPAAKEGYREPDDATLCWLVLQSDHTLRTFRSDADEKKTKKGSVLRSITLDNVVAVGRADAIFAGREEGNHERILKETGAASNTVRETFHRCCFALAMQNGTVIIFRPLPPANSIIGGHGWGDWTPDRARLSWIDNIEVACEQIAARKRVRNRVSRSLTNSPRGGALAALREAAASSEAIDVRSVTTESDLGLEVRLHFFCLGCYSFVRSSILLFALFFCLLCSSKPSTPESDASRSQSVCTASKHAPADAARPLSAGNAPLAKPSDGECSFMYRYIPRESCSQFDSLPLTSLTISGARLNDGAAQVKRERTGFRPRVDRDDAEAAKVLAMHGIRYIDPLLELTERERAVLRSDPPVTLADLLPKYLLSIDWTDADEVGAAIALMKEKWKRPTGMATILRLLGPEFSDWRVRGYGEFYFIYRYISCESCSQFDSLPLTSLTIAQSR